MTLAQLNEKIRTLPVWSDREEFGHLRDTRLGILGCVAGMEPTEDQCQIVHDQLFPPSPQKEMDV